MIYPLFNYFKDLNIIHSLTI